MRILILALLLWILPIPSFGEKITATAYSKECSGGKKTATGEETREGTIALSRDLLKKYPIGTTVVVLGKEYIVNDVMHKKWTNRVDIFIPSKKEALAFGKKLTEIKGKGHAIILSGVKGSFGHCPSRFAEIIQ